MNVELLMVSASDEIRPPPLALAWLLANVTSLSSAPWPSRNSPPPSMARLSWKIAPSILTSSVLR